MISFPDDLPRWDSRQKIRQRLQQGAGGVVMLASVGGAAFWWGRLAPSHGALLVAGILLTALPLGLWLLLDCPAQRDQRHDELAVFNTDKAVPGPPMLLVVALGFWLVGPVMLENTGSSLLRLEDWLIWDLWAYLFMGLMAFFLVAVRNEVLFVAPDGSAECWSVLGHRRLVEARPAMVRLRPLLGRCYVCDETGRVLYHVDRGMTNVDPLLDWLHSQGVANTGTEMRRRMAEPWPKVLAVLDWDEAERTPAHRRLPGLRAVGWLPFAALLVQWWLLVAGLPLLGVRIGSLLACWLPLVFFGAYLVWPQIFVWERYPTKPRGRYRGQVLATPAWRRAHVGLGATLLPVVAALLWALAESRAFLVGNPERLAVLCVVLGGLLALACEIRRPRSMTRERGAILLLAVLLAFPLGFSLNLALTAPAYPDHGTVVEVRPPQEEGDYATLTFRWDGRNYTATWYGDSSDLPRPEEEVNLCIRESPLGIHAVSVNC